MYWIKRCEFLKLFCVEQPWVFCVPSMWGVQKVNVVGQYILKLPLQVLEAVVVQHAGRASMRDLYALL